MFILYCKTLLLLLRWNTGKVRDRFGGRCKRWVNSVIIDVITEINYRCKYIEVLFKYKYNVKAWMDTIPIRALYQIINLNVSI